MPLPDFPVNVDPDEQLQVDGDQKTDEDGLYQTHHGNVALKGTDMGRQRSTKIKGPIRYTEEP